MAFYGPGTGANNGFWFFQWRDKKKRWIKMFGLGRYLINGISHTGQVVGGDGPNEIHVERRTSNGQPTEATIDRINPNNFESMDVKALLDKPVGVSDDDLSKARRDSTRPTPASYPSGTKITTSDGDFTKRSENSWETSDGNTITNDEVSARLDEVDETSAEVPEQAELSRENILNAVDGSTLSWNNKTYSRIDDKWYDDSTGKPVTDRTMGSKTDGDLTTDTEPKDVPSPTPASEYPTDTRLHAEMNDGDSTADLHKTDDDEWDIETDTSQTSGNDNTADQIIEAADTIDMDEFLQNPTESEPVRQAPATATQLDDEVDRIDTEVSEVIESAYNEDSDDYSFTPEHTQRLEELRSELDQVIEDGDSLTDEDQDDIRRAQDEARNSQAFIDENLRDTAPEAEDDTTPDPEPEVETETGQSVQERVDSLLQEARDLDNGPDTVDDDLDALRDIDRELQELDGRVESSDHPQKDEIRGNIANQRDEIQRTLSPESDSTPETEEPVQEVERTTDDIIEDLDTKGGNAIDQIENGSDSDLQQARTDLLTSYQEAQSAIDSPDTSNEDKVRLQNKVEEVDRAVTAIDQEIESRNSADDSDGEDTVSWSEGQDFEGATNVEIAEIPSTDPDDPHQIQVFEDVNGGYAAAVFLSGDDEDVGPNNLFETREQAREAGVQALDEHLSAPTPGTREDEDETPSPSADLDTAERGRDLSWSENDEGNEETTVTDTDGNSYTVEVYDDGSGNYGSETRDSEGRVVDSTDSVPTANRAKDNAIESLKSERQKAQESDSERKRQLTDEDTENSEQDPEPVDEQAPAPTPDQIVEQTQRDMEEGNFNINEVDESASFEPDGDAIRQGETADTLDNPRPGETVSIEGDRDYTVNDSGDLVDEQSGREISNEAAKILNEDGPATVASRDSLGRPGIDRKNKHGIKLTNTPNTPDHVMITNQDGTSEVYARIDGKWYRRLDSKGNFAQSSTKQTTLHGKINESIQTATSTDGERVDFTNPATPSAPSDRVTTESLEPGVPDKPAIDRTKGTFRDVGERVDNAEPNSVLYGPGGAKDRVALAGPDGETFYVGDRVYFRDRSGNLRTGYVRAVAPGKNGKFKLNIHPDEHDMSVPADRQHTYREWEAMTTAERKENGYDPLNYSPIASVQHDTFGERALRKATDEDTRETVQQRNEQFRAERINRAEVVTNPDIDPSADIERVERDQSTRIIGTRNQHGELFQRGESVEFGPNNELGTIYYISEADDRVAIIPDGQSGLEARMHHVDTISHSERQSSYWIENYDVPAQDRVVKDRNNNDIRIGDTVYRYGYPFTVSHIYPDGRKIRVDGNDRTGEQGAAPTASFEQLVDLGVDEDTASYLSGRERSHDFLPEHLQLFTGDIGDIESHRTHDSHMMTLVRDEDGNVLDTAQNRAAMQSRAIGDQRRQKDVNSSFARWAAQNRDEDTTLPENSPGYGDMIDTGVDQNIGENLTDYINNTFRSDAVIPTGSRLQGYNKWGEPETYVKTGPDSWQVEGLVGEEGEVDTINGAQFHQYLSRYGYRRQNSTESNRRSKLTFLGDQDDTITPPNGARISKTDPEKFAALPRESVVRFTTGNGNYVTYRKAENGKWYRSNDTGSYTGSRKGVTDLSDIPGSATYRGVASSSISIPSEILSREKSDRDRRNLSAREVTRNRRRAEAGREDRIFGRGGSGQDAYRQEIRTAREANRRADEAERAAEQARQEAARERESAIESLRSQLEAAGMSEEQIEVILNNTYPGGPEAGAPGGMVAAATKITAKRKGTDKIVAVYNRVNDLTWEYTSPSGTTREFTLQSLPNTPGITYELEEKTA